MMTPRERAALDSWITREPIYADDWDRRLEDGVPTLPRRKADRIEQERVNYICKRLPGVGTIKRLEQLALLLDELGRLGVPFMGMNYPAEVLQGLEDESAWLADLAGLLSDLRRRRSRGC